MMKLVVLSLFAAVAIAGQVRPLGDVTTVSAAVTVTAAFPSAGQAPTITSLSNPATYDSSAVTPGLFSVTGSATYATNNTITYCAVTYSGGGDNVVVNVGALPGVNGVATLIGSAYPVFMTTSTYTVSSISCVTANYFTYNNLALPMTLTAVAATGYVKPTITAYHLVSPQNGGCDDLGCDLHMNGTAMTTARANLLLTSVFRNPASTSGVIYTTQAVVNSDGTCNFNTDTNAPINANIGGVVGNQWVLTESLTSGQTLLPKNQAMSVSALITQGPIVSPRYTAFQESFFTGGLTNSVTFNVGSTDVTPPTCSVATLTPASINTVNVDVTATLTVTCADTGGSNLWIKGAFVQATVTTGQPFTYIFPFAFTTPTTTLSVFPYVSGSMSIIGVFAVDNAGNSVLYGGCGNAAGYDSVGCAGAGGGSSSASTVTLSVFAFVFLAISALFA